MKTADQWLDNVLERYTLQELADGALREKILQNSYKLTAYFECGIISILWSKLFPHDNVFIFAQLYYGDNGKYTCRFTSNPEVYSYMKELYQYRKEDVND